MNVIVYSSVGCYSSSCYYDPFTEIVDSTTCNSMAVNTNAQCYTSCAEAGYFLGTDSMTVEMCVQACSSHGFLYAGINQLGFNFYEINGENFSYLFWFLAVFIAIVVIQ
jgi:hypothetical protein